MGTLQTVPFHGKELFLVEHEGQPYTPVRPIVENLGINWPSQYAKLQNNPKRWGVVMITTPSAGGAQDMLCLPVIKLSGFMYSIDPRKVSPEHRPIVELYQEQCDKALFDFWTKGHAVHPAAVPKALPAPKPKMRAIPEERYFELLECENKVLKGIEQRENIPKELKLKIVEYHLEGLKPAQIRDITGVKKATVNTQIRNYREGKLK